MSIRTEKVSEEIKHQISQVLTKDLAGMGMGLVTVTKVVSAPDLLSSRIYLSFIGNKEPAKTCIKKIDGMKKQIRMHLASRLHLRQVPELNFYFDDTTEYTNRIEEIIKEIHKDDKPEEEKA